MRFVDINKLKAVADSPLIESSSKNKSQYDRISLTTTPAQKMELKERAKDADEISLSRFIIKILKKHGISPLNFYHFFLLNFSTLKL